MSDPKIQPSTITKPMQLLAAWLVGLLALDGCFLLAASRMPAGSTEVLALVCASILNVPLFLGALFLLQTKFRPELQEDLYYSTYINQKTNQTVSITRDEQRFAAVMGRIERVENLLETSVAQPEVRERSQLLSGLVFGINQHFSDKEALSEKLLSLGVRSHTWFGGDQPPKERVVSISENMPKPSRDAVLAVASALGFTRYNLFDNDLEEAEEHVLIGSYGAGDRQIPRFAG